AVGYTYSWRSALSGAALGSGALLLMVLLLGPAIVLLVPLTAVKLLIGIFLTLFGFAWLRKAILRSLGRKALHDEDAIYAREVVRLQTGGHTDPHYRYGLVTSFNAVFLEGLEVAVIVLTFGSSSPAGFWWASLGAVAGVLVVIAAGFAVRKPFGRIPENAMKFVVGIMLTSLGTLWMGEGLGLVWWRGDLSLLWIIITFLAVSALTITAGKRSEDHSHPEVAK
ncbi:MAG TPA: hypothetical protein VGZ00_05080, partial [Candidatus Baltobacteraceae bacterium]|nr:hypothetical protein [Candidatus Baltobacteraceae bacterium]